jgi:hypothetical protein
MRIRKWVSRAALPCATAIVITALVSGLWQAWMEWWTGRPQSQRQLWGWQIAYWGRVGLCLQFIAGLTVLLDLIGPERLRQWGESASSKREAAARQVLVAAAQRRFLGHFADLCECLRADLSDASPDQPPQAWVPDPSDNWYEDRVRTDGYSTLLLRTYEAFGGQFVCHDSHGTGWGPHARLNCQEGMRVMHPIVRGFLAGRARTEEETEAIRLLDQPASTTMFLAFIASYLLAPWAMFVFTMIVIVCALGLAWLGGVAAPVFLGVIVPIALVTLARLTTFGSILIDALIEWTLALPVLWLAKHEERHPRAYRFFRDLLRRQTHDLKPESAGPRLLAVAAAIRWQPVRSGARLLSALLGKAEPAHVLRWAAFVLFVVGFHFELLAS